MKAFLTFTIILLSGQFIFSHSNLPENFTKKELIDNVVQNFFPFESVSFTYKAEIRNTKTGNNLFEEGKLSIIDTFTFKNSRKTKQFLNNILKESEKEISVFDNLEYALYADKKYASISRPIGSYSLIVEFWNQFGDSYISNIKNKPNLEYGITEIDKQKYIYVNIPMYSTLYFNQTTKLLTMVDDFSIYKDNAYLNKRYVLDDYMSKDGFHFPTKITAMRFYAENEKDFKPYPEHPTKNKEFEGKKYRITKGDVREITEYTINSNSLKFNTVTKKDLRIIFPNGCSVRDLIKNRSYIVNDGISTTQREDILDNPIEKSETLKKK